MVIAGAFIIHRHTDKSALQKSTLVDIQITSTYIDNVNQRLAEAASGADPATGLQAARELRELGERLEALQVANARDHGWSWQEIAFFLGVSKQAVHKKHARRLG